MTPQTRCSSNVVRRTRDFMRAKHRAGDLTMAKGNSEPPIRWTAAHALRRWCRFRGASGLVAPTTMSIPGQDLRRRRPRAPSQQKSGDPRWPSARRWCMPPNNDRVPSPGCRRRRPRPTSPRSTIPTRRRRSSKSRARTPAGRVLQGALRAGEGPRRRQRRAWPRARSGLAEPRSCPPSRNGTRPTTRR